MFNKLVSSLPFNPSLINQVSFYAKRLKQEASIRRLGFILVALTMFLQLFAALSPAQPTLAREGNDIIPGGFTSRDQAVNYCKSNSFDFATILGHFGITCNNLINNSQTVSIRSTDDNNQLYSLGRQAQGPVNVITHKVTNEVPVVIGGVTYYMRLLSSWDGNWTSTYKALSVGNVFGVNYLILFSCGNIVQHGKPLPPAPTPAPKPTPKPTPTPTPTVTATKPCPQAADFNDILSCQVLGKRVKNITQGINHANGTTAKPGDSLVYLLYVKNTGNRTIRSYTIREDLSDVLQYANLVDIGGGAINQSGIVTLPASNIPAGGTVVRLITVKVKNPIPSTPQPCQPELVKPCPVSGSFDLVMTNTFGNTLNVKLPPTIIKTTEKVTTTTLPNTGPGTGITVSFALTAVVGYFFARSRLMAKEIDIIRKEYNSSGGM